MTWAKRRNPAGFTLLELLLAMALASIIAASLYGVVRVAFRARNSATAAVETTRSAEMALDAVKSDLSAALPPTGDVGSLAYAFVGQTGPITETDATGNNLSAGNSLPTCDDVIFYAAVPGPTHQYSTGDIRKVELTVIPLSQVVMTPPGAVPGQMGTPAAAPTPLAGDPNQPVLVRRVTSNLLPPQQSQPTPPDDEILCRDVTAFSLRYFDGNDWQITWDSTQLNNVMPAAVEVTLRVDPNGGRASPDGAPPPKTFVRVIQLPCASITALQDLDSGSSGSTGSSSSGGTK